MRNKQVKTVMITAGGTGGHLFPAEALARELMSRGLRVVFVSDHRTGAMQSQLPGLIRHRIFGAPLGAGLWAKLRAVALLSLGFAQSLSLVLRYRPQAVVGFGGYISAPLILAAGLTRHHVVLHEQNALLGRANRLLVRFADALASGFPLIENVPKSIKVPIVFTGNPVRPAIAQLAGQPYPVLSEDGALRVLVTGGSQGARIFSEIIPRALALLTDGLRKRLEIMHQCPLADLVETRAAYADLGIKAELQLFFSDMEARLASCQLFIGRAGASTIAEITTVGRPAILVPLPTAMDDHQTRNADQLAEHGGAWLMPQAAFTPEALAARLEACLTLPQCLSQTAGIAAEWGLPDAAVRLADLVLAPDTKALAAPAREVLARDVQDPHYRRMALGAERLTRFVESAYRRVA